MLVCKHSTRVNHKKMVQCKLSGLVRYVNALHNMQVEPSHSNLTADTQTYSLFSLTCKDLHMSHISIRAIAQS